MEKDCLLTIFTPTYNRAHTIGRTYESLCKQTNKGFKWVIVDDGSTDNTEQIVKQWQTDRKIPDGLQCGRFSVHKERTVETAAHPHHEGMLPEERMEL